jgi:hypothetical protein
VSGTQLDLSILHCDHHRGNQNSPRYTFSTMHIHLNFVTSVKVMLEECGFDCFVP